MTKRPSLIAYAFGESAGRQSGPRVSLYLTGSLALAAMALFLYLAMARVPFDVSVMPAYPGSGPMFADNSITNLFTLSMRNTGASGIDASLIVSSPVGSVTSNPAVIHIPNGQESVKIPLAITVHGLPKDVGRYISLSLTVKADRTGESLTKPVSFLLP